MQAAADALTCSVRACAFLGGVEVDTTTTTATTTASNAGSTRKAIIATSVSGIQSVPNTSKGNANATTTTTTTKGVVGANHAIGHKTVASAASSNPIEYIEEAEELITELSEEEKLTGLFNALPKHVRGHIKLPDVLHVLQKLHEAIHEIKADQISAAIGKIARQKKQALSRFSMKVPVKDLSKYCGQKASGKSGQAILLILRSLNTIKADRDFVSVIDNGVASSTSTSTNSTTTASTTSATKGVAKVSSTADIPPLRTANRRVAI
jgi:uncharacterized protein YqgV (UPF0045/DUF77 family)